MKVAIIGFGRFGRVLADMLGSEFEIVVNDPALTDPPESVHIQVGSVEEALSCDVVFYAVPISELRTVLAGHVDLLRASTTPKLLIDVLSVKSHPKRVFFELAPSNCKVLLTHPMFGPDSINEPGLEGKIIVMDQYTSADEDYQYWKGVFESRGLAVVEISAEEHDRYAASSQGLAHFVGRVLDRMDLEPTPIDTLGAKKLLEIKEQTCNDTWQLFCDLQSKNPYTVDMRVELGKAVEAVYSALLPNRMNETKLVVGISGTSGSWVETAAREQLNRLSCKGFDLHFFSSSESTLQALHCGEVDRAQLPVHSSKTGVAIDTVTAMSKYRFQIIEHYVFVAAGEELSLIWCERPDPQKL